MYLTYLMSPVYGGDKVTSLIWSRTSLSHSNTYYQVRDSFVPGNLPFQEVIALLSHASFSFESAKQYFLILGVLDVLVYAPPSHVFRELC